MKKLTTIVLGAALLLGSTAYAIEKGNFTSPKINSDATKVTYEGETFNFEKNILFDKDKDGTKETLVDFFKSDSGKKVYRLSCNGKTYQWTLKLFAKKHVRGTNNPLMYSIHDMDGNGTFESKYSSVETAPLPGWVK